LGAVKQLCESFKNVNRSVARLLELLPTIRVLAADGDVLKLYRRADEMIVVVRIRTNQEDPIALKSVKATTVSSQTRWTLLDPVQEFPVPATSSSDSILMLSTSSAPIEGKAMLEFEVGYVFGGDTINAPPITLEAESVEPSKSTQISPFIYGSKIDKSEILSHFVGRQKEQAAILQAIGDAARPKICYVHGIRRAGKSSLLESIEYISERDGLPLVPVAINLSFLGMKRHVGLLILDILESIANKTGYPQNLPTKERCLDEPDRVLRDSIAEVVKGLPGKRLVIILDDLQIVEDVLATFRHADPVVFLGFVGFLNFIWQDARPNAPISWLLAGHRNWRQLQLGSPEVLLWNALKNVAVDFFDITLVGEVIRRSLKDSGLEVPDQTISRIHEITAGYPEMVQMVGERMFLRAQDEGRFLLTPYDALEAARSIASSQSFETTWYPRAQLSDIQRSLMTAFVNAVPLGGNIEAFRLVRQRAITPDIEEAIKDLEHRQIISSLTNGTIKIKAHILELWLRNEVAREDLGRMSGLVAIFVDVANLTQGSGAALIQLPSGGTVQVVEVLKRIEAMAASDSPAPRGPRWAVNYPPGSPAVAACHSLNYQIKNIPETLYSKAFADKGRKGADDVVLREQISEVEQDWPRVTNYFVVTGDIDYSLTLHRLLSGGKTVSLVSWRGSRNRAYDTLKSSFPERFFDESIEKIVGLG
jgi:hypothetical protein